MKNIRFKNSKRAFTIVELVIVIAVISILAAVLIPTFAFMIKRAEESRDLQESENQAKQDFADSMLGNNEQSSSEQTPEETEPEETTPERISRDESELFHAKIVTDVGEDSVDYKLVYYLNRNDQNADQFDTVMKNAKITATVRIYNGVTYPDAFEIDLFSLNTDELSNEAFVPQIVDIKTHRTTKYGDSGNIQIYISLYPDGNDTAFPLADLQVFFKRVDGKITFNNELTGETDWYSYKAVEIESYYQQKIQEPQE